MKNQKEVWDNIAPSWDKHRKKISSEVYNFLKDVKGKLLDLGCGSGRNFILNSDLEIHGVDFSSEMIKLAQENSKIKGIETRLYVMDASDLKFEDEFFDACICNSVLHCIESKEKRIKILTEIYRTLKHNSKAYISSWSRNSKRLKTKEKECEIPWTIDSVMEKRYTYVYDLDELRSDLISVGFKIISISEDININVVVIKP